jgi:hypothetical protein
MPELTLRLSGGEKMMTRKKITNGLPLVALANGETEQLTTH